METAAAPCWRGGGEAAVSLGELPGANSPSRYAQTSAAVNIRPLVPAAAMIGSTIATMLRMGNSFLLFCIGELSSHLQHNH